MLIRLMPAPDQNRSGNVSNEATAQASGTVQARQCGVSIGCRLRYSFPQPTPLIALLNVHYSRFGDLERADYLVTSPSVPLESYRDGFGNWCTRLMAPAGDFSLSTDGIFRDAGRPDPVFPDAQQHAVQDLPSDTRVFLQGSRYCDTDLLSEQAWRLFETSEPGWSRVLAICDFVHGHVRFDYMQAIATRTASHRRPRPSGGSVPRDGVGTGVHLLLHSWCRSFTERRSWPHQGYRRTGLSVFPRACSGG